MKKKSALISGFALMILLSVTTGVVIGKTANELPRVTTACETKMGGVLMGIDDNFSSLKSCPRNSRKVNLGQQSDGVESSRIVFVDSNQDYRFVLLNDGTVWKYPLYKGSDDKWEKLGLKTIPSEVSVKDISSWTYYTFSTRNGDIWIDNFVYNDYDPSFSGWVKIATGSTWN